MENESLIKREHMNGLQLMALLAMVFSLLGGDNNLFTGAIFIMFCLKAVSMVLYEDAKEAGFAAIYLGFFVAFFFDLF